MVLVWKPNQIKSFQSKTAEQNSSIDLIRKIMTV